MAEEAERRPVPAPATTPAPAPAPPGVPPPATGTLAEILRDIAASLPEGPPSDDLDRIERALTRLERVLRIPRDPGTT